MASAIYSHGPVKVGVAADQFENMGMMPGQSGWRLHGYPAGLQEDHCVCICGFGQLAELVSLFEQKGVAVSVLIAMPTGLSYAMFTCDSIGVVDEQSYLNMTSEAWIRNPVTVDA